MEKRPRIRIIVFASNICGVAASVIAWNGQNHLTSVWCCDSLSSPLSGFIWSEIKQLWDVGLREYVNDMWNVVDFVTNALYVATVALRLVAYYRVSREQVWPLTQLYSVDFLKSRIDVKKCVFNKRTIKVCVSCC